MASKPKEDHDAKETHPRRDCFQAAPGGRAGCAGSVRSRASKYRLSWDEANPGSRGLQNGQHGRGPPEVEESAAIGGYVLVVAGARAEEVAQFVVSAAEPGG